MSNMKIIYKGLAAISFLLMSITGLLAQQPAFYNDIQAFKQKGRGPSHLQNRLSCL